MSLNNESEKVDIDSNVFGEMIKSLDEFVKPNECYWQTTTFKDLVYNPHGNWDIKHYLITMLRIKTLQKCVYRITLKNSKQCILFPTNLIFKDTLESIFIIFKLSEKTGRIINVFALPESNLIKNPLNISQNLLEQPLLITNKDHLNYDCCIKMNFNWNNLIKLFIKDKSDKNCQIIHETIGKNCISDSFVQECQKGFDKAVSELYTIQDICVPGLFIENREIKSYLQLIFRVKKDAFVCLIKYNKINNGYDFVKLIDPSMALKHARLYKCLPKLWAKMLNGLQYYKRSSTFETKIRFGNKIISETMNVNANSSNNNVVNASIIKQLGSNNFVLKSKHNFIFEFK